MFYKYFLIPFVGLVAWSMPVLIAVAGAGIIAFALFSPSAVESE